MFPASKILLTIDGLDKISREHEELAKVKLPKAITRVAAARDLGDLSENSEYAAAREELELLQTRIADLKATLTQAKVINSIPKNGIISLGSTVVVEVNGEKNEFMIVSSMESNPMAGKISVESPVGKALIGAKVGQTVEVTSAVKNIYKILEVK